MKLEVIQKIHDLHNAGTSLESIALQTGIDDDDVQEVLQALDDLYSDFYDDLC